MLCSSRRNLTDMPRAPPLGELAGASPTERARMLPNSSALRSYRSDKEPAHRCAAALSCRPCPLRLLRRHLSQRERLWQAGRRKNPFRRWLLREGRVIWQSGKIATYHRAKTHFAKVAICQSAGILTPLCQKGQNAKLANWQNIT